MSKEIIVVIIGSILVVGIIGGTVFFEYKHPCKKYHTEIQYQQPIGIVSGGVSIPIGNLVPNEVEICDER